MQAHEWSNGGIGPEITLISTDGRKFSKKFSLNLKVDTPPKLSSMVTIGKTTQDGKDYYVIILKAEDMTETVGTPSGLLHKEIKTLSVTPGTGDSTSLNIAFTGTSGFPTGDRLLAAGAVNSLGSGEGPWTNSSLISDTWALRYRTDTEVKAASKVYTFTLIDAKGLKSSPITVSSPLLKAEDVKLYHNSTDISTNAIILGNPYTINAGLNDMDVTVTAKTATSGAIITGKVEKQDGSGWGQVGAPINSGSWNEVNILLPAPGHDQEVLYKISLTAGGDGFDTGTEKVFYVKVTKHTTITINVSNPATWGGKPNAWEALKYAVEKVTGPSKIIISGTITAPSGAEKIEVNRDVTIEGTINTNDKLDANNTTYIFHICPNKKLTLKNLTLLKGNNTNSNGGAIYCTGGKLTTEDVIIENCNAKNGGAIYAKDVESGYGSTSSVITLKNTKIKSCAATGTGAEDGRGGAICCIKSSLTLNNTTIGGMGAGNTAKRGGGIYFTGNGKTCNIKGGAVSNNEATDSTNPKGGGVYVGTGAVFAMKGYAEVTPSTGVDANAKGKNDIYLANEAKITIAEKLEYERVARITPESYPESSNPSIQVLQNPIDNTTNVAKNYFRFTVTRDANKAYCVNEAGLIRQQVDTTPSDTNRQNWAKLKAAIESAGTNTVIYVRDICYANTATDTITVDNKTITLIGLTSGRVSLDASNTECRIFTIKNGGNLTIKNIELQKGQAKDGKGGGGILLENGGSNKSLTLENVKITSCCTSGDGTKHGAGIAIYKGTVTMKGKTQIWGCKSLAAGCWGGGVYIGSGGILTIDGYATTNNFDKTYIRSCEADKGGGVYIASGGKLELKQGQLSGNRININPKEGVAVYNENTSPNSFNWTGGTIESHGSEGSVIEGPFNNPNNLVAN